MYHSWKNGSHLKNSVTVEKMGHTLKGVSQLEKRLHLKIVSHLEKWVPFKKCVTFGKNGSHLKNVSLWKNGSRLKNLSHFEKWVILEKMCHR